MAIDEEKLESDILVVVVRHYDDIVPPLCNMIEQEFGRGETLIRARQQVKSPVLSTDQLREKLSAAERDIINNAVAVCKMLAGLHELLNPESISRHVDDINKDALQKIAQNVGDPYTRLLKAHLNFQGTRFIASLLHFDCAWPQSVQAVEDKLRGPTGLVAVLNHPPKPEMK